MGRLLDLLVTGALNGTPPTQHEIGIQLFGRDQDWIPDGNDAVVRRSINRLTKLLEEYYETEGPDDLVAIDIVRQQPVCKYNSRSRVLPEPPRPLHLDFLDTLCGYFADPYDGDIRCVVTGEPAIWHHLDGDPSNNAIGNLIPLCRRLSANIHGLRHNSKTTILPELDPRHLAEDLAPSYFGDWQVARAYACAHLAFYMGQPPCWEEQADTRLLRLCNTISYLRYRFNESIVAYVIRNGFVPLLTRIDSLDPRVMSRIALQLSGLLDESGDFGPAAGFLNIAQGLMDRFAPLVYPAQSMNRFTLLRRQAQLLMETNPEDTTFDRVLAEAREQIQQDANLPFTLGIVVAARWFRQGTIRATKEAYETLLPIVDRQTRARLAERRSDNLSSIDPANLAQLLIDASLAASRLRPSGWEEFAHETMVRGSHLCQETGFRLPPDFWRVVSLETYSVNPKAFWVSRLSASHVSPPLRQEVRLDIENLLKCLRRIVAVENSDSALGWWQRRST